jgi:hypothetical protein
MADLFSDCLGADAGVVAHAEGMMTEKQWKEPRLPKEKIAELAWGIFTGEVFTSDQIEESQLHLIPVLFLLDFLSENDRKPYDQRLPDVGPLLHGL